MSLVLPHAIPMVDPKATSSPFGNRIRLIGFPDRETAGAPVAYDVDGHSPVFMGSAIFEDCAHPCKIVPARPVPCLVSWGGREIQHDGPYELLPFDPNTMQWVHTSGRTIPIWNKPVE